MIEPRRDQWGLAFLLAMLAHLALGTLLEPPEPLAPAAPGIRVALGGRGPAGDDTLLGAAGALPTRPETLAPLGSPAETIPAASAPAPIEALETDAPLEATIAPEGIRQPNPSFAPTAQSTPAVPEAKHPTEAKRGRARPPEAARPQAPSGDLAGTSGAHHGGRRPERVGGGGGAAGSTQGGQAVDRYHAQLAAWLERHKRYPLRARQMRQEGVVRLRFVIDREGEVISHRVDKSSGHAILDDAASDLLRRASPMPAIPPDMGRSRLEIVVPIAYRLR